MNEKLLRYLQEKGYITADQADALRALAQESGLDCEIRQDLGGLDRVAILKRSHTLE